MTKSIVGGEHCFHMIDLEHQPSSGDYAASCPNCGSNYPQLQAKARKAQAAYEEKVKWFNDNSVPPLIPGTALDVPWIIKDDRGEERQI